MTINSRFVGNSYLGITSELPVIQAQSPAALLIDGELKSF
jgi:hypothetical protein